jgi:predicted phage terminase large subunit-like protein
MLSQKDLAKYLAVVDKVPEKERLKIRQLLEFDRVERCRDSFLFFVQQMWPVFISGRHHKIMADAFERVAKGELKRLIINMPPRHTKSEFASYLLPAWFLGKFPEKKIIQTAHTAELAVGFGRKVRNLVQSEFYQKVFPTKLSSDSKAAGRWNTEQGGDYFAIGVGGAVTGKGADILIIDDPHSEQEAKQGNPAVYDGVYEWYTSGPRQRLQPGGAIIIVMCMTGDTGVLMADGVEKPLRDIRPGDKVATFDQGRLTSSKVNNWQSSGVDAIYKIQTQSGRILRANERHPFLVMNEGVLEWTRVNQLRPGDFLVSLKDVGGLQGQKQSRGSAGRVPQKKATTGKTLTHRLGQWASTASGKASCALAGTLSIAKGCARPATKSNTPPQNKHQRKTGVGVSNTDTESPWTSTRQWFRNAAIVVTSAVSRQTTKTPAPIGTGSCVSTTATPQEGCEGCFATTATLQLGTERQQRYLNELQRISDFTTDRIVSIIPDGKEEVFDVEIDRTENFIANGFVSHNTRWAKRDLTGQILKNSAKDGTDDWEVIEFPAILPSGNPLWPGFWKKEELEAIKAEIPVQKWEAQYQQNPTSEEGAIIKREFWKVWTDKHPPSCEYLIQSWDTAFEKHNRADYSACTTWGIFYREDEQGITKPNIILLDAFKDRMEFPELKQKAMDLWKEWNPDTLIIEKRAAGSPLIYELRKIGIPLSEYTPYKGQDKIARVNSISDLFASGVVWRPETRWAEEVVEEMASFPSGDHDDLVDSSSQALMRFRQGGFISIASDEPDEPVVPRRVAYY